MLFNIKNNCMFTERNLIPECYSKDILFSRADKGVVSRSTCITTVGVSQLQRATPSLVLNSFLFNRETQTKMKEFLLNSNYCQYTDGMFYYFDYIDAANNLHLELIYDHYQRTGFNATEAYVKTLHASTFTTYEKYPYRIMSIRIFDEAVSELRRQRIPQFMDLIQDARAAIKNIEKGRKKYLERQRALPRLIASKYISDNSVRKLIFDYYGEKCLACGSGDRVALDHIVAVANKGTNEITNLQPLCIKCNVSKGTKTIDYRTSIIPTT